MLAIFAVLAVNHMECFTGLCGMKLCCCFCKKIFRYLFLLKSVVFVKKLHLLQDDVLHLQTEKEKNDQHLFLSRRGKASTKYEDFNLISIGTLVQVVTQPLFRNDSVLVFCGLRRTSLRFNQNNVDRGREKDCVRLWMWPVFIVLTYKWATYAWIDRMSGETDRKIIFWNCVEVLARACFFLQW